MWASASGIIALLDVVIWTKSLTPNRLFILTLALIVSACGVLKPEDVPATLRAANTAAVAEATTIAANFAADQAMVLGTAAAAGTSIAAQNSINRQLVLTERAIIPPTPIRESGSVSQNPLGTPDGSSPQFTNTGVATSVRDSDGCASSFETQIPQSASAIYINTKATTISGGTVMGVEWQSNGQIVAQETWTVPRDETNFCIWFNLDPARVPFTPGLWSVTLSADGHPIQPTVQFSIVEAMSEGS